MKKFSNCIFCLKAIRKGDKVFNIEYGCVDQGHMMGDDLYYWKIPRDDEYADDDILCHEECFPVNKKRMEKLRGRRKY